MDKKLQVFAIRAIAGLFFAVIISRFFKPDAGVPYIVGLAVILDLVVVGLAYGDALPPIIWISFAPYTASVLIALALAILLYRNVPQTGAPPSAPDAQQSR